MTAAATTGAEALQLPKGAVLFRQGDAGHEMFVVSAGRVRLTIGTEGHEKEVGNLGPGEFFGELSLLSDAPRTATAIAAEDTTLLVIGRDVFAMMVQDDLDIVFRMMNIQGRRLSRANQPIQDLTQRLGRVRVAAHLLRRLLRSDAALPLSVEIDTLAAEIGLSERAVSAALADLVERGIGMLHDGSWQLRDRAHIDHLLTALCGYTSEE